MQLYLLFFKKMKKYILLLTLFGLTLGCSKDRIRNTNPYIPNYSFSLTINTNLPLYSGLNSPINPIVVTEPGTGVNLILMKISDTDYRAWDANCPNQYPSSCSKMTISGINAKCPCDAIEYSLFTGVGTGEYTMKPYTVEVLGTNLIRVYN